MAIPNNKLSGVAFSTDFNYESVHMKGHVDMTMGGTASISHGLSYEPYCKLWYLYNGTMFPAGYSAASPLQVIVTPKPFVIELQAFSGIFGTFGNPVTVYYRIYKERAV